MKFFRHIIFLSLAILLGSCFRDKSTDATEPISYIKIESGIDSVYNIDKNDTLVISPVISQTIEGKQLFYTWEIDLSIHSNEETFIYTGTELGKFNCRLIIENEDGKTFFPFTLYVNSPYEEGITIISKDENGKPMLSFMQKPLREEDKAEFTKGDCFALNNKEQFFASNPTDIVQSSGSIIISCQGSEENGDDATIYFLNEKTFVMENIIVASEYETFKPTRLLIPSQSNAGVSYPVLSADGKVYALPVYDAVLQPSTKLQSSYAQSCFVVSDVPSYFDILLWDNESKGLTLMYNGYGPYYCGTKYLLQKQDEEFETDNYFKDVKGFIAMASIRRTNSQIATSERELLVLVQGQLTMQKVILSTFFWNPVEGKPGSYTIPDNGGLKSAGGGKAPLDENTPCIANKTFNSLLYAYGNQIRRWYYTTNTHINNAETLLTVGSDNAIITGFEMSDDHLRTYVTFYEPEQEGLNGSLWIFDTDKGTVLEKHENICYKPVKMIYKNR